MIECTAVVLTENEYPQLLSMGWLLSKKVAPAPGENQEGWCIISFIIIIIMLISIGDECIYICSPVWAFRLVTPDGGSTSGGFLAPIFIILLILIILLTLLIFFSFSSHFLLIDSFLSPPPRPNLLPRNQIYLTPQTN